MTGKIKELLQEELGVPAAKQELHGWIHKNDTLIKDEVNGYCADISAIIIFTAIESYMLYVSAPPVDLGVARSIIKSLLHYMVDYFCELRIGHCKY